MMTFEGIAAAAMAAGRVLISGASGLPDPIIAKLTPYVGVPGGAVDLVCGFAEAVFANAGVATETAKEIAGGCAMFGELWSLHALEENSRGTKIATLLAGREVDEAPEPKVQWLPVPVEPAPVPPLSPAS